MDIVDLYFSEEEYGVDAEREISDQYARYSQQLDEMAEQHFNELAVEMG